MTSLVAAAFAAWAAWRRPDWVSFMLLFAIVASGYLGTVAELAALPLVLSFAETAMVLSLLSITTESFNRNDRNWTATTSRARLIGLIGAGKIIVWITYIASAKSMTWVFVATLANCGLGLQILVAGGVTDGAIKRIGNFVNRARHNFIRRLGNGKVA